MILTNNTLKYIIIIFPLIFLLLLFTFLKTDNYTNLSININEPNQDIYSIYYDIGNGFNESDITRFAVRQPGKENVILKFRIPEETQSIRLHLGSIKESVLINQINWKRHTTKTISSHQLESFFGNGNEYIEEVKPFSEGIEISTMGVKGSFIINDIGNYTSHVTNFSHKWFYAILKSVLLTSVIIGIILFLGWMLPSSKPSQRISFFQKLFFIFSTGNLTLLLSFEIDFNNVLYSVSLSLIVSYIITFHCHFLSVPLRKMNKVIGFFAILMAIEATRYYYIHFSDQLATSQNINALIFDKRLIALFALYAFYEFFYWFLNKVLLFYSHFKNKLDSVEKYYFVITGLFALIVIALTYNMTNVFYSQSFDKIFTFDSGHLFDSEVYKNIGAGENDLRQPLFGLYALPFSILATYIGRIFYFVPSIYPIALNVIQVYLLLISVVLISRLLNLRGFTKVLFLMISTSMYPMLLFSLAMEQYAFAVFWLVLFIYLSILKTDQEFNVFPAMTGSLLTSGILILFSTSKNIRLTITRYAKSLLVMLGVIIIFGQLKIILNIFKSLDYFRQFSGENLPFSEKIIQYFEFLTLVFVAQPARVIELHSGIEAYRSIAPTTINVLGIIILIAAIIGFILNYKDKLAQFSFFWVSFSFLILCIIGWGTEENGLILYSLYFSWAFLVLIVLLINKLTVNLLQVRYAIFIALIIILCFINIPAIVDLIQFAIEYYPVERF